MKTQSFNPSNEDRAQRGRNLVDVYVAEHGGDGRCCLQDMLADLKHMCAIDCEAPTFEDALRMAEMHFEAETEEAQS